MLTATMSRTAMAAAIFVLMATDYSCGGRSM
jgi:hypothetical protein